MLLSQTVFYEGEKGSRLLKRLGCNWNNCGCNRWARLAVLLFTLFACPGRRERIGCCSPSFSSSSPPDVRSDLSVLSCPNLLGTRRFTETLTVP